LRVNLKQDSLNVDCAHLVQSALTGDRRTLAKLLTIVENDEDDGQIVLMQLFPHTGQAHIVGITGSPGSGKSTLVNCMVHELRKDDVKVAVVAVDPTSPFSGGALLGDRLRMRDLAADPGVFIRSMASRGHPGGVAHATRGVVNVLDAAGFPIILVETVGAGQAQVEVAQVAHTVILVEAPGMGDDIQALKAGMMEIADIVVVNKSDRPGAQRTVQAIKSVLMLHERRVADELNHVATETTNTHTVWSIPVLMTSAINGHGIPNLLNVMEEHKRYLLNSGLWQIVKKRHVRAEIEAWLRRKMQAWLQTQLGKQSLEAAVGLVLAGEQSPVSAAQDLFKKVIAGTEKI
jgi:LAO/AO transport system kinase